MISAILHASLAMETVNSNASHAKTLMYTIHILSNALNRYVPLDFILIVLAQSARNATRDANLALGPHTMIA